MDYLKEHNKELSYYNMVLKCGYFK